MTATAKDIYQDHADRTSHALWVRDWDTVLGLLSLPYRIATQDVDLLHETEADLRRALQDFRGFLDRTGARNFSRIAIWADFHEDNPDLILGEHQTFVLRGGQFAVEPYVSAQVLARQDGVWRGVENRSWVSNSVVSILSPEALKDHAERRRARLVTGG